MKLGYCKIDLHIFETDAALVGSTFTNKQNHSAL
jgi:hypothetical protein